MTRRMLDLFCGRWGWSRAFAARGWECVGVDLVESAEIPQGCEFIKADVMQIQSWRDGNFGILEYGSHGEELWNYKPDFVCASSPCEKFAVFGMKHFHPNPPHPQEGIELFNYTRAMLEYSGVPYVMENVRAAQQFVGRAAHHCGSFYLWGRSVPPLLMQGVRKGASHVRRDGRYWNSGGVDESMYLDKRERASRNSTIPPELANCVADYAERLLEQKEASWAK